MKNLIITFCLFISVSTHAKRFANQYTEFELPLGWECALEGSEYICQSTNADRQKEAIIILAAKTRGEQDNLSDYQEHLQKSKTFKLPGGRTQVSEPKYTTQKTIAGHVWVDSLHLASEIPGFFTRYLATVKNDLGMAITFSVSKDHYDSYKSVFDAVVESLKIFRQANADTTELVLKKREENLLGEEDSTYIPPDQSNVDISRNTQRKGGGSGGGSDDFLFFGLILAAVGIFIFIKKKKKG